MSKSKSSPATTPVAPAAPVPATLYIYIGSKRGLTGHKIGPNADTLALLAAVPGASTTGAPLSAYQAAAGSHKRFVRYAVKSHWLVPAPKA